MTATAIAFLGIAAVHFVATLGSLVLATAVGGHIDARESSFATSFGELLFGAFVLLSQPLGRFWLQSARPGAAYGWMALNSALWATVIVLGVRWLRRAVHRRETPRSHPCRYW